MSRRTIFFVACTTLLVLVACKVTAGASPSSLQADLEKDGYTSVVITPSGKDTFTFTAKKGIEVCTGSITSTSSGGTTSTQKSVSCATAKATVH